MEVEKELESALIYKPVAVAVQQVAERCWSDLPFDILQLIISKVENPRHSFMLSMTDKFFLANRKRVFILNLNKGPPVISPAPHLLMFHTNKLVHQLCQPVDRSTYHLDGFSRPDGYQLEYSKHGWFLMTRLSRHLFFYNPITRVKIDLPQVPYEITFGIYIFFCPPTSSECEVIGVQNDGDEVTIGIVGRQNTWKFYHQNVMLESSPGDCFFHIKESSDPIWFRGVLCCFGVSANLMTFDRKRKPCCFSFIMCPNGVKCRINNSYTHSYLVDNDGELLVVFIEQHGTWVAVYQVDLEHQTFQEIHTLGNKVLYVSAHGCFSEKCAINGTGNKIYLSKFHGDYGLFYCLNTNKFHTCDGYSTNDFYDTKFYPGSMWIKPTFDYTCRDEFNW